MTGIQAYNDENLARLKLWLTNSSEQDNKKYFEVLLDGMKIIYKTDDLAKLEDLSMWVDANAKVVKVLVYSSSGSHRYQVFEFRTNSYIQNIESEKQKKEQHTQQSLSGFTIEVDQKIAQAIQNERKEQAFEGLKRENRSLKDQLGEANVYIGKLEDRVQQYDSKKLKLDKETIITIGSGILGNVVKTNPEILDKVPGLSGLASAFASSSNTDANTSSEEKTEVSFRKIRSVEVEEENELDEETQEKLNLFDKAAENLNDEQYQQYFEIVQFLAINAKLVTTVYGLLKDENERLKKAA